MSSQPTIYEINAPIFLRELSEKLGRAVTFADVPGEVWDEIARRPFTMVWFMGVWKRSQVAREMALHEDWLKAALPDIQDEDIIGSAYSIMDYHVDETLGGNDGLAIAREELRRRGLGLMLDFVPNHVGIDHPWAAEHPDYFIQGSEEDLAHRPTEFIRAAGGIYARGRDPHFEPWSDVLQLNGFAPGLRQEVKQTLIRLSEMCDGLRCDMAMLLVNDIFHHTWGERAGEMPEEDYWPELISAVKVQRPDFLFLAEVYWDKELLLLEQGFDFCYDKDSYDYLIEAKPHALLKHLDRTAGYQDKLLRFVENHDEERAGRLGTAHHALAAFIMATLPGAHLYHEGEFEARTVRVPVHLSRRKSEEPDAKSIESYERLFSFLTETELYNGEWRKLEVHQGLFSRHAHAMLAYAWKTPIGEYVFCANLTDDRIQGSVPYLKEKTVAVATDQFGAVLSAGVLLKKDHVRLGAWQGVVLRVSSN